MEARRGMESGAAGARTRPGTRHGGVWLGREEGAWLGQRHGVCRGGGAARAEAHRVRWNGSRGEGKGLEDERSEFFLERWESVLRK
jgi:hypothetical protein